MTTSFELTTAQIENIHHFVNKVVHNDDAWTTLVMDAASNCAEGKAVSVVAQMLSLLDLIDPEDIDLSVEYIMAALAFKFIRFTPLFAAALAQIGISSFSGITKVRNSFKDAVQFHHIAQPSSAIATQSPSIDANATANLSQKAHSKAHSSAIASQSLSNVANPAANLPKKPHSGAISTQLPSQDATAAAILSKLAQIQQSQDAHGAAIAKLQHPDSDSSDEDESSSQDDNEPDSIQQAILDAVNDIQKKMAAQNKEIKALQSQKGHHIQDSYSRHTLDDSQDDEYSAPMSAKALKEMSSPMTLTHPMVHFRYDAWEQLAKGGSTDRQVLIRTLKDAFQCSQKRLNHQRDVLMELLDYALQKDYKNLIKLIGDRSHFLSFLDEHTLQESTHYWQQLRQDERPQRFRAAETSTILMGQHLSHQHAKHLSKEMSYDHEESDRQGGGSRPGGGKTPKKKKPFKKPKGKKPHHQG